MIELWLKKQIHQHTLIHDKNSKKPRNRGELFQLDGDITLHGEKLKAFSPRSNTRQG